MSTLAHVDKSLQCLRRWVKTHFSLNRMLTDIRLNLFLNVKKLSHPYLFKHKRPLMPKYYPWNMP